MSEKINSSTPNQRIPHYSNSPETITAAGDGLDRRSLLSGYSTRTRVTTLSPEGKKAIIIVGGNDQNDGSMPVDRPPLVINEDLYKASDGAKGLAVLPYSAKTLRGEQQGVWVGEDFVLGAGNLGRVIQIDHVPPYNFDTLTPDEQAIKQSFESWEAVVAQVGRMYDTAQTGITPPDTLP